MKENLLKLLGRIIKNEKSENVKTVMEINLEEKRGKRKTKEDVVECD